MMLNVSMRIKFKMQNVIFQYYKILGIIFSFIIIPQNN
jgi:hypothetical protein